MSKILNEQFIFIFFGENISTFLEFDQILNRLKSFTFNLNDQLLIYVKKYFQ